ERGRMRPGRTGGVAVGGLARAAAWGRRGRRGQQGGAVRLGLVLAARRGDQHGERRVFEGLAVLSASPGGERVAEPDQRRRRGAVRVVAVGILGLVRVTVRGTARRGGLVVGKRVGDGAGARRQGRSTGTGSQDEGASLDGKQFRERSLDHRSSPQRGSSGFEGHRGGVLRYPYTLSKR